GGESSQFGVGFVLGLQLSGSVLHLPALTVEQFTRQHLAYQVGKTAAFLMGNLRKQVKLIFF
ncbi:MAG: hypothetical protein COY47_07760, partial [Chloroflexi bacterium CG_4_10_14_0_8_um_filter_57_5]